MAMYLQQKEIGPFRDYILGEKAYIILSFTAKQVRAPSVADPPTLPGMRSARVLTRRVVACVRRAQLLAWINYGGSMSIRKN